MKTQPYRGSHLPVLMKLVQITEGPIVEFGSGMYSSPYLHWSCLPKKRKLVTFENHPKWIGFIEQFKTDFHEVIFVENWDLIDLSALWSIAFIDHDPFEGRKRSQDIARLTHAEYVVAHDAENRVARKYGYPTIHSLFKYRWKYSDGGYPYTAVFSNYHDLSGFDVL